MTPLADPRSIVGIDPTSRGLAFVFFEHGRLLDWGTRRGSDELALLDRILNDCPAEMLVLEDPDAPRCERRQRMRQFLRDLARHAGKRGLSVVTVPRINVRRTWALQGVTRKH